MLDSDAMLSDTSPARAGRHLVRFALIAFAVAAAGRGIATLRANHAEPGLGASWIWADGTHRDTEPVAFYAVRDVELPAHQRAWVALSADETYILYVNGQRIGANTWRDGAPADLYEVTDFVDPGWNRLVVEVASSRGAGGLLASLRLNQPDQAVLGTDANWQIVRRHDPAVLRGFELGDSEPARVWGRQPSGRWHPGSPEPRPVVPPAFPPRTPVPAVQVRFADPAAQWISLADGLGLGHGDRLLFDWGSQICGTLDLELVNDAPGLLAVGAMPPSPSTDTHPMQPDSLVIPIPGRQWWADSHPRCFRYALVLGVTLRSVPRIHPLPADLVTAFAAPPRPLGLLGIQPPEPAAPAEDALRRRVEDSVEN